MLTRQDIISQREQMQDDLMCVLDGLDDDIVSNACQVVVDRCNILLAKYNEPHVSKIQPE